MKEQEKLCYEHHDEDTLSLFTVFLLAIRIRIWKIYDWCRTFLLYYFPSPRFFAADTLLLLSYFWTSPYRLIRQHDEEGIGPSLGPYGETPFTTLESILNRFSISKNTTIIDTGSGRGRALLWLSLCRKQKKVIGVEPFQLFNKRLQPILQLFRLSAIEVSEKNLYDKLEELVEKNNFNFSETILYVYLSALPDSECIRLIPLLSKCPGLRIISISFWLGEYGMSNVCLLSRLTCSFPWGEAEVFYQQVHENNVENGLK